MTKDIAQNISRKVVSPMDIYQIPTMPLLRKHSSIVHRLHIRRYWDTQWDMFMAFIGAIIAQLFLAGMHEREIEQMHVLQER
jgi:hypothetical protein